MNQEAATGWWNRAFLSILFGLLGLMAGCQPSALQQDFGQAWLYNLEVQIANPQAGLEAKPVTGLSPEAGKKIMESYNKSFERQQEQQKTPKASIVDLGTK